MTWYSKYKRYKKLVSDLLFERAELDFVRTVVDDISPTFNGLEFEYLKQKYSGVDNFQKIEVASVAQPIVNKKSHRLHKKHFSRMYKSIAKKIHPDKFCRMKRTQEIIKKEEMFRQVASAYRLADWAKFLEIAEELSERPLNMDRLIQLIPSEIKETKRKAEELKTTYGWQLYECNEDPTCIENLMQKVTNKMYRRKHE